MDTGVVWSPVTTIFPTKRKPNVSVGTACPDFSFHNFSFQLLPSSENLLQVFWKCSILTQSLYEEQLQGQTRAIRLGSLESARRWRCHSPSGFHFCWDLPSERHPPICRILKAIDRGHSHPVCCGGSGGGGCDSQNWVSELFMRQTHKSSLRQQQLFYAAI